jgi:hypothetical protein
MVGETLERMAPDTTLIVMSDHGFASWRRAFHLNSWLRDNGYLALVNPYRMDDPGYFGNVDWGRTRAYGLGLNGLYLNLQGREAGGIVTGAEHRAARRDPRRSCSRRSTRTPASRQSRRCTAPTRRSPRRTTRRSMPDLLVGYALGTRCSNESALGGIPRDIISDNTGLWTGDHCMDHEHRPRHPADQPEAAAPAPSLEHLGAAIVAEFREGFQRRPTLETAQVDQSSQPFRAATERT